MQVATKPLMSIPSKAGAKRSHAKELSELCANHPLVRVRFTGPYDDTSFSTLVALVASVPVEAGARQPPL